MSYENPSDSFISDEEDDLCPLCVEEMDITDKNFKPCPCGYQVCQFCYNNIRTNPELNGKCPACRRPYEDKNIEYKSVSTEEWKSQQLRMEKRKREKKQIEKEKKDAEQAKRHHLAGMRVIQKNLVYVVGLSPPCSSEDLPLVLRSDKYFGQYGKILKIVINKRSPNPNNPHHTTPGYGVYVTFARKEDATRCINAVDGSISDGKVLRAAHGTTKYCSSYLRGQPCPNPNCMFLHEPGEEADSYTRQDLSTRSINNRLQQERSATHGLIPPPMEDFSSGNNSPQIPPAQLVSTPSINNGVNHPTNNTFIDHHDAPSLPATVSWAKSQQNGSNVSSTPDTLSVFPTLGDVLQQAQQQKQQQPSPGPRKKEKKEKDFQNIILDDTLVSYKSICDSIKQLNNENTITYSVRKCYKTPESGYYLPSLNFFHQFDLNNFEDKQLGYLDSEDNKNRIIKLVDSLLFTPYTKNYNYKSNPPQQNGSITQQDIPRASAQTPAEMQSQLQNQYYQQSQFRKLQNQQSNNASQQFLQQKLLHQQQQQLKIQQQSLSRSVSASASGSPALDVASTVNPSATGNNTQPPPGLFNGNAEFKTNSAELLNQLMGGKKVMA